MKVFFYLLMMVLAFSSCKEAAVQQDEDGNSYYGEKIENIDPIGLAELMQKLEGQDSVNVQLEATVESVCQKKGCWMNLVDNSESDETSLFVKFKDYGFFVPKDISGRKVIVEGVAYREITPVEELRHYAEDEGKSEEEIQAITEPKEELKFMAEGVVLVDGE